MHLIEILMISVGISLNVFAVVVCFGAVLLRVERHRLIRMLGTFCLIQVFAVLITMQLTAVSSVTQSPNTVKPFYYILAVVIFIGLGIFMLRKAIKNEPIIERVCEITYQQVIIAALVTGIDAVFAGFAFGLMKAAVLPVGLCTLFVTALLVVLGIYTGYRLGYEQKTKAYAIGGSLLLISAAEIVLRYLIGPHLL